MQQINICTQTVQTRERQTWVRVVLIPSGNELQTVKYRHLIKLRFGGCARKQFFFFLLLSSRRSNTKPGSQGFLLSHMLAQWIVAVIAYTCAFPAMTSVIRKQTGRRGGRASGASRHYLHVSSFRCNFKCICASHSFDCTAGPS